MTRYPPVVVFATVMGAICFPIFALFGVIWLTEGKTATGLALLACVAVGVMGRTLFCGGDGFASRFARPS